MRTVVLLLSFVASALVPASAAQGYPRSALEDAAYDFWGGRALAACPTGIATVKQAPYQDEAQDNAAGWARPGDCVVHLSVYRDFAGMWPSDCATFLHEVGHIVGYGHDFTGYGHIMEGDPLIVRAAGFERRHGQWRRVIAWGGIGTYWCRRYAARRADTAEQPARPQPSLRQSHRPQR